MKGFPKGRLSRKPASYRPCARSGQPSGGGLVAFALAAQLTGAARFGELRTMAKGAAA